ncbi:methylated-DNA--[protein]-cysteine S-methyltransferase [Adhaeribacter aquaticus]|uniref:methylated-DNA--[protein]-cysteine S-methyltransferase n=1 Tax=Adhaeribacter aquaticus TaxID=299567 RepID=UPI0004135F6F|nr:methylated-DNA--[protein]-cysteine S-methyltransferase [Adhaeribacter aquaticus]
MDPLHQAYFSSPIGTIIISATAAALISVLFTEEAPQVNSPDLPVCLQDGLQQLTEYFSGNRKTFDLPLHSGGTAFQETVWQQLSHIPFGQTLSYYSLSSQLGNVAAIRAVGSANGKNQLLLIRPCHRVIGSNGQLVGYAGSLWRKKWLLEHERKVMGTHQLNLFG